MAYRILAAGTRGGQFTLIVTACLCTSLPTMGMKLCTSISPNCNSPYVVTAPDERPRAVCYSLMWLGAHDHNAVAPRAGISIYNAGTIALCGLKHHGTKATTRQT